MHAHFLAIVASLHLSPSRTFSDSTTSPCRPACLSMSHVFTTFPFFGHHLVGSCGLRGMLQSIGPRNQCTIRDCSHYVFLAAVVNVCAPGSGTARHPNSGAGCRNGHTEIFQRAGSPRRSCSLTKGLEPDRRETNENSSPAKGLELNSMVCGPAHAQRTALEPT